ncbi:MAG: ACT domain-containing protein [Candidatus Odinarchaeum yellowstonii]|uniref:ACT domain-containing protein n=1 Tax=Odinarchaeota yellowstonii (strain LCB_4) TaxID=1841599 RepID=A0AAF0IAY6_ODILC|nr:MAG: ACT domain-containing protein [Candidatus Odinarchaeum yellowstonii]
MQEISIAEASRRVISNMPSVIDAIKLDILNYSSLAELIAGRVEKIIGRKAGVEAIKMALMRYSEDLKKDLSLTQDRVKKIIAGSVLELKNDLTLLTVKQSELSGKIDLLFKSIPNFRFLQLTQGTSTFNLIIDERGFDAVKKVVDVKGIMEVYRNQSAIILISPPEIIKTPGVVSHLLELLARNNINITQVISCHTDTVFLVDKKDALTTYRLLEDKIISMRNMI